MAIEKQNYYIHGESGDDSGTPADSSDFVDIDALSEIVFDQLDGVRQLESRIADASVLVEADTPTSSSPPGHQEVVGVHDRASVSENMRKDNCRRTRKRGTLLQQMKLYIATAKDE